MRFANESAGQLFGFDPDRAPGRMLIEALPSVALEGMVARAIAGETVTGDVVVADGPRERMFGVTARPLEGLGAVAIAADRTKLLDADRVRREFIANVSHELRTPLTSVRLMLETIDAAGDDPEARALFLPRVAGEVERMIRLVEDLLELTRSESGTLRLRRERFDLGEIGRHVAATFAARAEAAGVALSVEAPVVIPVDADRERLTQVALNLVDNALRHTPAGGTVRVEAASAGRDAILLVRDSGTGIPLRDLPHVFERFYVVDRSRARGTAGTGLGLAIAKHLVEAHAGSIAVESVWGRGAAFTVRLPLALGAPPSSEIKGS